MATSSRKWKNDKEISALHLLKSTYPDELSGLKRSEEPDLQLPDFSIGIEVVQSLPSTNIEAKALRIQEQCFKKLLCSDTCQELF